MRLTMLIVEDQDPIRAALREYLRSAYPRAMILEASDGARAIDLCGRYEPRLVFMDVSLPDSNGVELTARIKALLPHSQVIVVSQHDAREYVERSRAAGAFAYVAKDRIHRELLPVVARALSAGSNGKGFQS